MFPFIKYFLHIFFPACCPVCGAVGEVACETCLASFFVHEAPVCFECGLRAPCPVHENSAWIFNFSNHEGRARDLVLSLKYGGNEALGRAMGRAIGKNFPQNLLDDLSDALLVPLPLHKGSERKFNQAKAISEGIGSALNIKICDALFWARHVEGQTGKKRAERISLPKNIFRADKKVAGKKIVIVDDVCTTGTTLRRAVDECSKIAEVVGIIVWAKAAERGFYSWRPSP